VPVAEQGYHRQLDYFFLADDYLLYVVQYCLGCLLGLGYRIIHLNPHSLLIPQKIDLKYIRFLPAF
jgi:hypothetical protein